MGADDVFGAVGDWQGVCRDLRALVAKDPGAGRLRSFIEDRFRPVAVSGGQRTTGLFTGYFAPEYPGSLTKTEKYDVPLYGRPRDLVTVDLGRFRPRLAGERIAGKVENGRLIPYATRQEIEAGPPLDEANPVAWLADPVDAFFLHIQGSGVIRLENGRRLRVGYAGRNGHEYTSIGRILVAEGALDPDNVSMQSIRRWLESNKSAASRIMRMNESYIFFQRHDGTGPIGSEGVALTPGRSLAVDASVLPLGVPVWLDTQMPGGDGNLKPLRRLMVAQDTGSAIKGVVRGDVFWGTGPEAAAIAGRMQAQGRYYALVPANLLEAEH